MLKFYLLMILILPFSLAAQTIEKRVFVPRPQEKDRRYAEVSFAVPAGTKCLTISYQYEKKDGANVIDLGLFDSRFDDAEKSTIGFRGWSGGRRETIFIAETAATNGYVPGSLRAGTWHVILGLYKIAPEGVEVGVKIKLNEIDEAAQKQLTDEQNTTFDFPRKPKAAPPVSDGYTWYAGDLHLHSFHSDGSWTIRSLLDFARREGLDFVGLTDHNTFSHHAEIDRLAPDFKDLLVLRGEEVTTYGGHFNVWGLASGSLVDFRITPKDTLRLEEIVAGVHRDGLLASINHPTAVCGGCAWSYGDWTKMDSVEIWNGAWDPQDEAALKKWDDLLTTGKRITAIGSSDTHTPPATGNGFSTTIGVGSPATHAGMKKLTEGQLFEAIRRGRIWISRGADNFELEFTANGRQKAITGGQIHSRQGRVELHFAAKNFPAGSTVRLISNGKEIQNEKIGDSPYTLKKIFGIEKDSYFRIEIRDAKGAMLALTNPVFVSLK
jgi:hypothetical protein